MSCITFLGSSRSQFEDTTTSRDNYVINVKYSPCDGRRLVSLSNDNVLRFFTPVTEPSIEDVLPDICLSLGKAACYDMCWHPSSKLLATSSKRNSILAWNPDTGENISSYPVRNHVDEITGPHSLQFDPTGEYLFCGFEKVLKIVNLERPNSVPAVRHLKKQGTLLSVTAQSGIISSIAVNQQMYCLASYSGHIGMYDAKSGFAVALIEGGHSNRGITQVQFAMNDTLLVSAARKDCKLCVWDLRQISIPLAETYSRNAMTNQRIRFDIFNSFVFSGSVDGNILMYDLNKLNEEQGVPVQGAGVAGVIPAHGDCCNSVSCMPPNQNVGQSRHDVIYLASGSGQRRYNMVMAAGESDSDSADDEIGCNETGRKKLPPENGLKFWKIHK